MDGVGAVELLDERTSRAGVESLMGLPPGMVSSWGTSKESDVLTGSGSKEGLKHYQFLQAVRLGMR
jgi:hypothetical protein